MSTVTHNPNAEPYAEIEELEREIRTLEPRIEFLEKPAAEHAELVKQRDAAAKKLAALRKAFKPK